LLKKFGRIAIITLTVRDAANYEHYTENGKLYPLKMNDPASAG